jgi:hypothetical protein
MNDVRELRGVISLVLQYPGDDQPCRWRPFKWVADDEVHVRDVTTGEEYVITVRSKT